MDDDGGVMLLVFVFVLLIIISFALEDSFGEIDIEEYKQVSSWISQEPSIKPKFDEFYTDKKIIGTEYYKLKDAFKEAVYNKTKDALFFKDGKSPGF